MTPWDHLFEAKKPDSKWEQILSRHPKGLRTEIEDERPQGDRLDIKEIEPWHSQPRPLHIPITTSLVRRHSDIIGQAHPDVVAYVNRTFRLKIKPRASREKDPTRYMRYAKMPARTAKPSVMVNGEIYWGIGRFIAALLRGDKHVLVWKVNTR